MAAKRAKATVFINGKLEAHAILDIKGFYDKDGRLQKKNFIIQYPSKLTKRGYVDLDLTIAYVSIFSHRASRGLYMVLSLYNPIFTRVENYPLKTLAETSNPSNLNVSYAQ